MNKKQANFKSAFERTIRAGKKRTYFFDVRANKTGEYYLTISESVRKSETANEWDRHKIFLYKEDLNRFTDTLNEAVNVIKTELMPQYDYDEFTRKQEEYEASLRETLEQKATTTQTYTKTQRVEGSERFVFNNTPLSAREENTEPTTVVETRSAFDDDDLSL